MTSSQMPNGYGTNQDVAALFKVNPKTVARWAKDGKLPHSKTLGGHRRYDMAEMRALADATREEVQGEEATP